MYNKCDNCPCKDLPYACPARSLPHPPFCWKMDPSHPSYNIKFKQTIINLCLKNQTPISEDNRTETHFRELLPTKLEYYYGKIKIGIIYENDIPHWLPSFQYNLPQEYVLTEAAKIDNSILVNHIISNSHIIIYHGEVCEKIRSYNANIIYIYGEETNFVDGLLFIKHDEMFNEVCFSHLKKIVKYKKGASFKEKAINFSNAVIKHIRNGGREASEQVKKDRLSICRSCEHLNSKNDSCNICGCFVQVKVSFPTEECPMNPPKWFAMTEQEQALPQNNGGCGCGR